MSNYPPGVSGNEPEITGEWPCRVCDGAGHDDDMHSCLWCGGSGIEPEDPPYCPNCGEPTNKIEHFYYNRISDTYKCNHCVNDEDVLDPRWEKF